MPWNAQGGGGGPWGGGGGGQGPWGRGPQRGGGATPPDLDEMIRKGQDQLKNLIPGGGGNRRVLALIVGIVLLVWLTFASAYRVQPGEQGVVLLFGKYMGTTGPGLNFWFPPPFGEVVTPDVERTNQTQIGFRGNQDLGRTGARDVPQESLMLTGDQNIADIDFVVQWRIKDAANYLFNIRDPENTVKIAAESAMREVIGQTSLEMALTQGRQRIEADSRDLLQQVLDSYGAGIFIAEIKLQKSDPPKEVIDAFNDVQRARQDKERAQNEAVAYFNDIVPRAKGEAERVIQQAAAYKEQVTKEAEGEAARFLSVYNTYRSARDVTTQRLYLEALQDVLGKTDKVVIDRSAQEAGGVVPYLPLPELQKRQGGSQ